MGIDARSSGRSMAGIQWSNQAQAARRTAWVKINEIGPQATLTFERLIHSLYDAHRMRRSTKVQRLCMVVCCAVALIPSLLSSVVYAGSEAESYCEEKTTFFPRLVRFSLTATRPLALPFTDRGMGPFKRIAAARESEPDTPVVHRPSSLSIRLSERIRRAGELLATGQLGRAKDIIQEGLRECQGARYEVNECSEWMRSLQGLNYLLGNPDDREVITNSIGQKMVRIFPREYLMGSPKRELDWLRLTFTKIWRQGHKQWFQDELPLHPVRITRPFYFGATDVTVGQFRRFVEETRYKTDAEKGNGGAVFSEKEGRWVQQKDRKWNSVPWRISDDQPVVFVSWNDAQEFCAWLSRKEKKTYRLPTEAEWEMACRGGSVWVRYPWGERLPRDRDMNFGDRNPGLPDSLSTIDDGYEYVAPVGSYPPNAYGLYDMAGNVMQWVNDWYDSKYFENSPIEDPPGPRSGSARVTKGGDWLANSVDCRCAFRGFSAPDMSFWNLGFRVVMEDQEDSSRPVRDGRRESFGSSGRSQATANFPSSEEDGILLFREAMSSAQQQQWDSATEALEQALKFFEERGDGGWVAQVRATLAGVYAEQNRIYKSKELYAQALSEFRKMGDSASAHIILARLEELGASPGVKVVQVRKGGIADRAGVAVGDVIIEYAGETGFRLVGFKKLVQQYSGTDQVTFSFMRNGEITTTVVSGGLLGVEVEDIKRHPRLQRAAEPRPRERQRPRGRGARR